MKHTLAILLVAAAASKVQAINSCPDETIDGYEWDNMGVGQLVDASGTEYPKVTISGTCLTALAAAEVAATGSTDIAQTAAGCYAACNSGGTDGNGCAGAQPGLQWPIAIGWNDDTKDCTCYSGINVLVTQDFPSINLQTDLGDDVYGCNYVDATFLLYITCQADQGDVELDVAVSGEFDLEDYNCDTTVDLDDIKEAIETALEDECNAATSFGPQCRDICKATVTKLTVEGCDRRRGLKGQRQLQTTTGTLNAEFFTETIVKLADPLDVHIAEQIAEDIFELVKDSLDDGAGGGALNDGTIEDAIDTALAAASATDAFDGSVVLSAHELSKIISKALGDFGNFYPAWHDGDSDTCVNDGNYPQYMENNNYFKPSLEECCKHYYSWDFTTCMMEGGAPSFEYTNYEFYVDYGSDTCKQSCPEDTEGMNCGGLHKSWQATYETAEECCKDRLFWLHQDKCIAESEGGELDVTDLGSGDYYVDWKDFKCVKDCHEDSGDAKCGGLAKGWDQLYDSQSECCSSRLSWVDQDECNE